VGASAVEQVDRDGLRKKKKIAKVAKRALWGKRGRFRGKERGEPNPLTKVCPCDTWDGWGWKTGCADVFQLAGGKGLESCFGGKVGADFRGGKELNQQPAHRKKKRCKSSDRRTFSILGSGE